LQVLSIFATMLGQQLVPVGVNKTNQLMIKEIPQPGIEDGTRLRSTSNPDWQQRWMIKVPVARDAVAAAY
jgi:hypothetical protein